MPAPLRSISPGSLFGSPLDIDVNSVACVERMNASNTLAIARIEGNPDLSVAVGIYTLDLLRDAIDHAEALGAEAVHLLGGIDIDDPSAPANLFLLIEQPDGTLSRLCVVVGSRRYRRKEVE